MQLSDVALTPIFGMREVQQANAKGHADYPLSDDDLLARFNANVSYAGLSQTAVSRLAREIMTIDEMKNMCSFPDSLEPVLA